VSADEANVDHAPLVFDDHHEPVLVAGDVEDYAVSNEAGTSELVLQAGGAGPIGCERLFIEKTTSG
jgi:hypothetical protein